MRVRLKNILTVTKTLATGAVVAYCYAWRGGPRLTGMPGSPEFIAAYVKAHADRRTAPPGNVFSLVAEFRGSAEFTGLARSTRKDYSRYLRLVEEEFGDMPLAALSERDGKPIVWVVDPANQTVAPRNVETESFAPGGVRIAQGLAAGELVVTAGTQFMTPDKKVRIADAPAAAAAAATVATR